MTLEVLPSLTKAKTSGNTDAYESLSLYQCLLMFKQLIVLSYLRDVLRYK